MKKISTKKICVLAMLLAITVVLSYFSGYLRIGSAVKFSISFISVYLAAALYGPLAGGFVGAMADVISCMVNPVGAFIWKLTAIEFLYGVMYGFFFYRKEKKFLYLRTSACVLIEFFVNMIIKTKVLSDVGYVPEDFSLALSLRLPSGVAMLFVTAVVISVFEKQYMDKFREMINK